MRYPIILLLIMAYPFIINGQTPVHKDILGVKEGIFYYYPPNSDQELTVVRDKIVQQEIQSPGDTSFWQVRWDAINIVTLTFIRASRPMQEDEYNFYKAHPTVMEIKAVTKNYYIFHGAADSLNGRGKLIDTMWIQRRLPPTKSQCITQRFAWTRP